MSVFNRQARRSGGYRKAIIVFSDGSKTEPLMGIACFEKRHKDCDGKLFMLPGDCACDCHNRRNK